MQAGLHQLKMEVPNNIGKPGYVIAVQLRLIMLLAQARGITMHNYATLSSKCFLQHETGYERGLNPNSQGCRFQDETCQMIASSAHWD
jgi:hypothetical protein